jgi:hypothetical protein
MIRWSWLLLLVLVAPSLSTADPGLNDFAYGVKIAVPPGTPVAALSLPEQIYKNARRSDLGDIRVFNTIGEPVPHMLRYARTQTTEAMWQPLALFPLPEEIKPEDGGYRVYVRTGPDGAVVRVDPRPERSPTNSVRTYLIDASRLKRDLVRLRLVWPPVDHNLMAMFTVDTSDDLVTWKTIKNQSAISDVRYGGHRLLSDTITLKRGMQRYLRLRQTDSGPAVPVSRIDGQIEPEGRAPIRAFLQLTGHAVADAPGVFDYRTGGAFPIDRVNLIFDQANSMAQATLASRNDTQASWKRRFQGLFYRIDVDHTSLTSSPRPVAISIDRYWRLSVDASGSTIGNAVPRLEIDYRPHDLFFIARGSGPFTLAYGSTLAQPLRVDVAALFDGLNRQHKNELARWVKPRREQIVLGGPDRLSPQPKPLPIRRIVLWSILVAGVLVVACMAIRLARRMKAE